MSESQSHTLECRELVDVLLDRELSSAQSERLAELVLGARIAPELDARVLQFLVSQQPKMSACPGRDGAIENAVA